MSELVDLGERHRVLLELGRGGMSRIYLAETVSSSLRRLVVVKLLSPEYAADPDTRSAFRREAELGARLNHPNIVNVFEVYDCPSGPVMVMEYLEGISLSQVLKRKPLPLNLHLHVLMQVLAGLHNFHELRAIDGTELGGVHRDVSPQNVLVLHEGFVKLLDFGIAKVRPRAPEDGTRAGVMKGKIRYMPLEQLAGETTIDRRADIFAVGVMLWEAIAQRPLWANKSDVEVVKEKIEGRIPSLRDVRPDLPSFDEVVRRAMAARPEGRYSTAQEMQLDLEKCIAELGGAVHSRQLADFMAAEFGDERRELQAAVQEALRGDGQGGTNSGEIIRRGVVAFSGEASERSTGSSSARRLLDASRSTLSGRGTVTTLSEASERRTGRWFAPLALVLVCLLGWLVVSGRLTPGSLLSSYGSPDTAVAAPTTTSSISAHAPPMGSVQVAAPVTSIVETVGTVDAPAHGSASAAPSGPAKDASPAAPATAVRPTWTPPPPPVKSPPLKASGSDPSAPTPAASAPTTKPGCTPPYTVSADGVKAYKPECF